MLIQNPHYEHPIFPLQQFHYNVQNVHIPTISPPPFSSKFPIEQPFVPKPIPKNSFFTQHFDDDTDVCFDDDSNGYNDEICTETSKGYIHNVFMNHPAFNTHNDLHNELYSQMIEQQHQNHHSLYSQQTLNTQSIQIPVKTVDINIISPFKNTVISVADLGSDIECINKQIADKYIHHIQHDPKGRLIRTGNGPIQIHKYLLIKIQHKSQCFVSKFWVLPQLPFQYLIGRNLIHLLGYDLINRYEPYIHYPEPIDDGDADLDMLSCSNYPINNVDDDGHDVTPIIDYDLLQIENPELDQPIKQLLKQYDNMVAKSEWDKGNISLEEFRIDWIDDKAPDPWKMREYPIKKSLQTEVDRHIGKMIDVELIRPSRSCYVSPIFAVPKKTGDIRIVFDYRKLNSFTKRENCHIPRINELLAKFKGKSIITSLDLKGGYWHIPILEEHKHKTAFIYKNNIYEWNFMPFGPMNAPIFFQRVMNRLFGHLEFVTVYIDDISIFSDNAAEHIEHLKQVFDILIDNDMKLRIDKCVFGVSETEYLGFLVNNKGIKCTDKYKDKILNVPRPRTKKELQRYIGLLNYLQRFIDHLAVEIKPLTALLRGSSHHIHFEPEHIAAFKKSKLLVENTDYLLHPDITKEFHVFTDASKYGIGAMIAQYDDNNELHPVSFCSKTFNDAQQRWHCSEQEIYAVVYALEKWRYLLMHSKFHVHTDHKNLQILFNNAQNFKSGKLYRWAVRLQDFYFVCHYVPASHNKTADYISRDGLEFTEGHKPVICDQKIDGRDIYNLYTNFMMASILNLPSDLRNIYQNQNGTDWLLALRRSSRIASKKRVDYSDPPLFDDDNDAVMDEPVQIEDDEPIDPDLPYHSFTENNDPISIRPNIFSSPSSEPSLSPDPIPPTSPQIPSYIPPYNQAIFTPKHIDISDYYPPNKINDDILFQKQLNDPLIFPIIHYLHTNKTDRDLLETLPEYLIRYVDSDRYKIKEDGHILLFKHDIKKEREYYINNGIEYIVYKKVIPSTLKKSIMKTTHDIIHHGHRRVYRYVSAKYWWPGMSKDIWYFCRSCDACQRYKGSKKYGHHHGKMKLFSATRPFQQISVDIVGPLPMTDSGYRYIVTAMDKFSRYCMMIPVGDIKALTVLKALEDWFSTFGPPESILSDNGSQFTSKLYKHYNKTNKTKILYTSTYHPECNGQIERFHRWMKERLALIGFDSGLHFEDGSDDWSTYLNVIQYKYNTSPNRMTSYTPFDIIFGFSPFTPLNMEFDPALPQDYIDYMIQRMAIIRGDAKLVQKAYDEIRKKSYDKKRKKNDLAVGDLVLYDVSHKYVGNDKKLKPNFIGPFEIVKIFNDGQNVQVIDLQDVGNPINTFRVENTSNVPLKHIKPYHDGFESPITAILQYFGDEVNIINEMIENTSNRELMDHNGDDIELNLLSLCDSNYYTNHCHDNDTFNEYVDLPTFQIDNNDLKDYYKDINDIMLNRETVVFV